MTHFIDGNHIRLLRNGGEYFPAIEAAIDSALQEIYLQTYIYEPDVIGIRIGNALKRAAQRDVTVNVLLDGFGCKYLSKEYIRELQKSKVNVMFFRPKVSPWTFKKMRLRRLHSKVVMVDGLIGFVGGINIIDDYDIPSYTPKNIPPRIDYAVRIEGAILSEISAHVRRLWHLTASLHLQHLKKYSAKKLPQKTIKRGVKAAFVFRDNLRHRHDIEKAYLTAIASAKSEVIIANAYFLPGRRFRQALLSAAKRGVSVKLLLQGRVEYFLMYATHAFYRDFLKNGILIYEYRKSFMHSKVAVIDSEWVTVGSSNIDPFSFLLAREANVLALDKIFAMELRADILNSIKEGAHQVALQEWDGSNIFKRIASWIAYGLVRAFLGLIGHSSEH